MKALFLAMSPLLQSNASLPSIDNVHVYALVCHLLGIQPNPNNGTLDAWKPYLRDPAAATTRR